jgi:hypothetical protein
MKARIVDDLLAACEDHFGLSEGHRSDPDFDELRKRIQGQVVELVMIGDDAFELEDFNWWLPPNCWEPVDEA